MSDRAVARAASHFQTEERNIKDYLRGIHRRRGEKPLEEQPLGSQIMHYIGEVQKLTDYEILIEGKVEKLLRGFYDLIDDNRELAINATWWKNYFVKHMMYWFHFSRVISERVGTVNVLKIRKGLPKALEVAALKKTLLDYEEKIKGEAWEPQKGLIWKARRKHMMSYRRGEKRSWVKEELGYISIPPPSLTEMREQLRRHLREAKKEERLRGRSIMIRVSPKIVRETAKRARMEQEGHPPAKRTYGIIEKVDGRTNTIIVKLKDSEKRETFIVESSTKITEEKDSSPLLN